MKFKGLISQQVILKILLPAIGAVLDPYPGVIGQPEALAHHNPPFEHGLPALLRKRLHQINGRADARHIVLRRFPLPSIIEFIHANNHLATVQLFGKVLKGNGDLRSHINGFLFVAA